MKFRNWMRKKPVLGSLAVMALAALIMDAVGLMNRLLPEGLAKDYLIQIMLIALPLAAAILLGYGWIYRRYGFGKTLLAGLFAVVIAAVALLGAVATALVSEGVQWKAGARILLGILTIAGIGFREETLFRGIIASDLGLAFGRDARGVWKAVGISGLMFGLIHLTNFLAGVSLASTMIQAVNAVAIGMFLTAVYFRGGSIWALAFIHALIDAGGLFQSSFTTLSSAVDDINKLSAASLIMVPVYVAVTAFLLRKKKMGQVLENLKEAAAADRRPSDFGETPDDGPAESLDRAA